MAARKTNIGGMTVTQLRFALGTCSLGAVLVAATGNGVAAILFGDDPGELRCQLQDRFPRAQLIAGDEGLAQVTAKIIGFIEAPTLGLDLPLDPQGTEFQLLVWRRLCEIPAGATASYAEIARRVGTPKAARAVAQACASNALAVAIPCHRVVSSDGALAGYRWGIGRKRALLAREAA